MDEQDRPEFATAIGAMLATFGSEGSRPVLHGYWLGLSDLPLQAVQMAVASAVRQCETLPRPVDLRRLAGEQTHEQRALAAWSDVLRAVPLGAWKWIDFQDKLCNAAIRNLGGWPTFLDRFAGVDGEKWVRLEFIRAYQALAASGVNSELLKPLVGLSQATSIGGKQCEPPAALIECEPSRRELQLTIPTQTKGTKISTLVFKSP